MADIELPSLAEISFRRPLDVTVSTTTMNTERHNVICKCTWRHKDGGDIFLLIWWFLITSMQNDRNETRLHNKYDFECIRNTLSVIHYFPSKFLVMKTISCSLWPWWGSCSVASNILSHYCTTQLKAMTSHHKSYLHYHFLWFVAPHMCTNVYCLK